MELSWLGAEPDPGGLAGAVAVLEAAREQDSPWEVPFTTRGFGQAVRHGWDGDPSCYALARESGRPVGVLEVGRPRWDNHHLGYLHVTVDPVHRRRGIGLALYRQGLDRVRGEGRTLILTDCHDTPGTLGFCAALGLERGLRSAARRLDLVPLDQDRIDRLAVEASLATQDYDLVRLPAAIPADHLHAMVELTAAINDAPLDDLQLDDDVYTVERLRAFERAQLGQSRRLYRLVARHRPTGDLAGHTVVAMAEDQPWHAWQYDTSVLRAHRGHRLGMLLKTAMLRWLTEAEPQLRQVDTWNADTNTHMVEVNDRLGCRVIGHASGWQLGLDQAVERADERAGRIRRS